MNEPQILADMRWRGPHGIGRFAKEVYARIPEASALPAPLRLFHPLDPLSLSFRLRGISSGVYFTPGFNVPLFEPIPLVLTVHDLNYVHFAANSDTWRRTYFSLLVRPACRRAYRILTVSEFSRSQIIAWSGVDAGAVINVGNGIDGRFNPHGPRFTPGFPYLLAMGSKGAHKNIARLVQAYAISGLAAEMKLLISGRPDPDIDGLVRELKLGSEVMVLGHVEEAALADLYRGAIALCMPSLFEGFGLPVAEAMACGVPVLTSTATSLPEIAGDAAVLVDPMDVESIAHGLVRIASDESVRVELRGRGLRRSRDFSWDRTAELVRAVLHAACSAGG